MSALLACTACGSIPTREFEFDAIDVSENARPCLVVLNDDWTTAAEKERFVNLAGDDSLVINIEFPKGPEFEVTMAPVLVVDGKVPRVPKSRKEARDYSGYVEEVRRVRLTDPRKVLCILPKKSGS
ncbi:MAG TPA: hypothetical protein VF384_12780 [Planctomycetota bacterium]